jgi:hypothetical protein
MLRYLNRYYKKGRRCGGGFGQGDTTDDLIEKARESMRTVQEGDGYVLSTGEQYRAFWRWPSRKWASALFSDRLAGGMETNSNYSGARIKHI